MSSQRDNETIVLASLVQIYAAVLYNFSIIGGATDINNYAGFIRFQILAKAQGVIENEDGTFEEQRQNLADLMSGNKVDIMINRLANAAVSIYAIFKIVQTIFFS